MKEGLSDRTNSIDLSFTTDTGFHKRRLSTSSYNPTIKYSDSGLQVSYNYIKNLPNDKTFEVTDQENMMTYYHFAQIKTVSLLSDFKSLLMGIRKTEDDTHSQNCRR